MKYALWILSLPLTIVAVVFALTNQQLALINLWPLGITWDGPVYLIVFLAFLVGFILGGLVAWVSAGKTRSRARHARNQARRLEREKTVLEQQSNQGQDTAPAKQVPALQSSS